MNIEHAQEAMQTKLLKNNLNVIVEVCFLLFIFMEAHNINMAI